MADLDVQRQALAATRARIDTHLDELARQVPDRDHIVGVATRIGAAAGGLLAGVGVVVVLTKSRLSARRDRTQGRKYAEALLTALPEVAMAWQVRADERPAIVAPLKARAPEKTGASAAVVDGLVDALDLDAAVVNAPPRGGAPTAILMGLGVIGGVAIQRLLNEG